MRPNEFIFLVLFGLSTAVPNHFDRRQNLISHPTSASQLLSRDDEPSLPIVDLGYASYQAAVYNDDANLYTFKNIRYADPPTGNFRWMKPQPPSAIDDVQDGSIGFSCYQGSASPTVSQPQSEDCLFLDVYAPGDAMQDPQNSNLPVVVWIHGGSNSWGAKDQINSIYYNGTGVVQASNNSMIFVSINYRLGAMGWLSGNTMEKGGLPNAGLHDQRAALSWVQDNIGKFGGDKTRVSAWGESAGAADIFHHLVAQGGTLDPLFSKAIMMSPAMGTIVDRNGSLENCFQAFANAAGCQVGGLDCLRQAETDNLHSAMAKFSSYGNVCAGPAADGTFIRQAASMEFATGNFWKNIGSVIVTHTSDEANIFTPKLTSDAAFKTWITNMYPAYAIAGGVLNWTVAAYPALSLSKRYVNQQGRASAWILDAWFASRVRSLVEAYSDKIWAARYNVPSTLSGGSASLHSGDLIPLFWNKPVNDAVPPITTVMALKVPSNITPISATYKSYFISHALTGDPNTNSNTTVVDDYPSINWPRPGNLTGENMTNVLNFGSTNVSTITDPDILKSPVDFAHNVVICVTNLGGYAVPGTERNCPYQKPVKIKKGVDPRSQNYVNQCTECRYSQ